MFVLDHLVVDDSLILESNEVRLKVDDIIVNWTRKRNALPVLSGLWAQQYTPLAYVNDGAFSLVMCDITMYKMSSVISNLPDGKAAGLSEAWMSMIPKPYVWDGILLNTRPIALIETAKKILSKVFSNRIFLACSKFDVLCGNNFSVLKGTSTQSPISAVGSIVEDALEKGCELWLVLQDMYKMYDSVVRQGHLCGYWINSNFVAKTGRIKTSGGMTSFFVAGIFVDNIIWVENRQASTQHIFDVISKFFLINDININNEKMVAISINKRVGISVLSINGQTITVANPGVSYQYLGIFLSTNGLFKPSLAKANADVRFFSNMPIVSYWMQFSFVSKAVCLKWDVLIRKSLKSKANLLRDFSNKMLHHPFLYGLKSFEQLQAEYKIASILRMNTSNNLLVGVVHIFLDNKLSLDNWLLCAFRFPGHFPMSLVLGNSLYFNVIRFLKITGMAYSNQVLNKKGSVVNWCTFHQWRRLGSRGPMPLWFLKASTYLNSCLHAPPPMSLASVYASADKIDIYTDSSLRGLSMFQVVYGAAAYFPSLNKGLGVEVHGVLSSTLAKLQTVALALECVPASVSIALHTDSQAAIDACVAELGLLQPNCHNSCWIERHHVINLIKSKDLTVRWIKIKDHAGIADNIMADAFAKQAAHSRISLPIKINCRYVVADGRPVSGNACHFVHDIFYSICKFQWEVGPGQEILSCLFGLVVNWNSTTLVWHPDSHMLSGSTCQATAVLHTYFMKAVHFKLPIAVRKRLYNKNYPGVSCLFCGNMELPDHDFTCVKNASVWSWFMSDVSLYSVFCKRFVLKSWMNKVIASLSDKKKAAFVFRFNMEKSDLIGDNVVVAGALSIDALLLSAGMVHLTSVLDFFDVGFGFRDRFLFLSGAVYRVSVSISV
ncbi:hypothetical protein G9A89_013768 [Geosiphon pyriformis]|nr:hypothetical protein G9A89_013768 [Geosiphon pyriformis]